MGDAELVQHSCDVLPRGRGLGVRDVNRVGATQHFAQIGLGRHRRLGIMAAGRQRGLDPADIRDRGGDDELFPGKVRESMLHFAVAAGTAGAHGLSKSHGRCRINALGWLVFWCYELGHEPARQDRNPPFDLSA
nr:hypothetical protein [Bradyrhizobium frederickii]